MQNDNLGAMCKMQTAAYTLYIIRCVQAALESSVWIELTKVEQQKLKLVVERILNNSVM